MLVGMSWSDVIAICVASGGPAHVRSAAAGAGLDVRSVVRRTGREGWPEAPFPGVLIPPGTVLDGRGWATAAIAYATRGSFDAHAAVPAPASGRCSSEGSGGGPFAILPTLDAPVALTRSSALAHLGVLRSYPSRVELVVSESRGIRPTRRLVASRSRLLLPEDIVLHDGLPVLRGAPLLRELASVRDRASLRAIAIDLTQAGWLVPEDLPSWLACQPRFPGKARLREVMTDLVGAGRTDSSLEYQVRQGLRAADIPLDRGQVPLPGGRQHLDLGVLAIRFGIELAGFAFHHRRADLTRDAQRANAVAALEDDWRVLHATWDVLERGWADFVEQIRDVVGAQSRRHLGIAWPRPEHLRT